jgi:hypothetical protein
MSVDASVPAIRPASGRRGFPSLRLNSVHVSVRVLR